MEAAMSCHHGAGCEGTGADLALSVTPGSTEYGSGASRPLTRIWAPGTRAAHRSPIAIRVIGIAGSNSRSATTATSAGPVTRHCVALAAPPAGAEGSLTGKGLGSSRGTAVTVSATVAKEPFEAATVSGFSCAECQYNNEI